MRRKHFFAGLMAAAMVLIGVPAGIGGITAEAAVTIAAPDVTVTAPAEGETPADAVLNSGIISSSALETESITISSDGGLNGKLTAPDSSVLDVTGSTKLLMHFQMKSGKVDHIESIIGKMNKQFGVQIASMDSEQKPISPRLSFYAAFKDGDSKVKWAEVYYNIPNDAWYDTWHDVVAYYDGSALHLYVDGNAGTDERKITGELKHDDESIFTIGYNTAPDPADTADPEGNRQKYFGQLKDVGVYVGANVPTVSMDGMTLAKLKPQLVGKTSSFELKTSVQGTGCSVKSTTWEPKDSKFGRYGDYKVTVVLKAGTGNTFRGTEATLRTAQGVLSGAKTVLNSSKTEMTITYTFKGEEHPRDILQKYLESPAVTQIGTRNEDDSGIRRYTRDTWTAYRAAYDAAAAAAEKEGQQPDLYRNAKEALEDAIRGLAGAAENCECVLSGITGFEGETVELYEGEERKVELGGEILQFSNDCVMHGGSEPQLTYELAGSPAGAVLEGRVLKLTADASSVQVRLTVTLGEQTKTATATYTVKKKDVNDLREELYALMKEIAGLKVGDYTANSWNAMKAVYDEAMKLDPSVSALADYLKSYRALEAAKEALVKKSAEIPSAPVSGQICDTKSGRYEIISPEKRTVRLLKPKNKKASRMGVAASITINGEKYKVIEIGTKAFKGCKKLEQITLSKDIQTIGKQAFAGCRKLSRVIVKGAVLKKIKSGAFKNTAKKITVTFKSKKMKTGKGAALLKKMKKAGMSKSARLK